MSHETDLLNASCMFRSYFGLASVQGVVQTYLVECDLPQAGSTITLSNLIKVSSFFLTEASSLSLAGVDAYDHA